MASSSDSVIADFYNDRSIFITGATGFMGKVMVEKLLRSCKGIRTIYILLRQKKGKSPKERLEQIFTSKAFDLLRESDPDSFKKVVTIAGDITNPNLGISQSDAELLAETVSIVFHMAATVRFDERLKNAVTKNVLGTRYVLNVCQKLPHLEALLHVSTAYSQCDKSEISEEIYPPPVNLEKIISTVEWLDEDILDSITPSLISGRPNTYTFTKALAENLLVDECGTLPIVIVRPSIVSASWKEPFPGWVDSWNGPTGLLAAGFKGVLRSLICDGKCVCHLVPVDVSINLMIVVAWHTATFKPNKTMIYNNTPTNGITWDHVLKNAIQLFTLYPASEVFRIPGGYFTTSRHLNMLRSAYDHFLPALCCDVIAYLTGRKPVMLKNYKKLYKALDSLEYFRTNEWIIHCENAKILSDSLNPVDKQLFNFDMSNLNWVTYWEEMILGIRKYLFNEDHSTLPLARRNAKRWYYLGMALKIVLVLGLFHIVFGHWGGLGLLSHVLVPQFWS